MGYTHYWRKVKELDMETFKRFAEDCDIIAHYAFQSEGINIANGIGEGYPEFTEEHVYFNGLASKGEDYETFCFTKVYEYDEKNADDHGLYFDCTKTEYRPYDCIVTACLICAKHHFTDNVYISSDGEPEEWIKGFELASIIGNLEYVNTHLFDKPSEDLRKAYQEKIREERKLRNATKPKEHSISSKETAKLIRTELKKHFSKQKFSVISDYNSIRVSWENGPSESKVKEVIGHFHSIKDSDDYYSPYCNQYLFYSRDYNKELYISEAKRISGKFGAELPEDLDYYHLGTILWNEGRRLKFDLEHEVYKQIAKTDYMEA